jgi:hypothetical protein
MPHPLSASCLIPSRSLYGRSVAVPLRRPSCLAPHPLAPRASCLVPHPLAPRLTCLSSHVHCAPPHTPLDYGTMYRNVNVHCVSSGTGEGKHIHASAVCSADHRAALERMHAAIVIEPDANTGAWRRRVARRSDANTGSADGGASVHCHAHRVACPICCALRDRPLRVSCACRSLSRMRLAERS